MHKTLYIDIDEEITSIVDRIRKEGSTDIFLVVPKNALLVQGIINLRILKKEAHRLGKNVMMVANDKFAKKVIERAGLVLTNKPTEEPEPIRPQPPVVAPRPETEQVVEESLASMDNLDVAYRQIGSSSFFGSEADIEEEENSIDIETKLSSKVPELTPRKPVPEKPIQSTQTVIESQKKPLTRKIPSLDVRRIFKPKTTKPIPAEPSSSMPDVADSIHQKPIHNQPTAKKIVVNKSPSHKTKNSLHPKTHDDAIYNQVWDSKKAEEFFSESHNSDDELELPQIIEKKGKSRWFLKSVITLLIFALLGSAGWGYWNYPQVKITIFPANTSKNVDQDLKAIVGKNQVDITNNEIPAKYFEQDISKTIDFQTTGEKAVSDEGKAKGKVTIYNKFSTAPQSLVASTRILSKEGKLFHLINSVTVPGMSGAEAGKIEAEIVADKTGNDFNIGPSSFTIEGFKGTPKYEKFEVTSTASTGNGSAANNATKVKMVTSQDLETARQQAIKELDQNLEQQIKERIDGDQKILMDAIQKDIIKSAASKKEGDQADSFTYTLNEKIKILTIAENDIRQVLMEKANLKQESGYEITQKNYSYTKVIPDFEKKSLNLKVQANFNLKAKIDPENIKKGIVGKSEEEIQTILTGYQELKKAEINFTPAWLNRVPAIERKIQIKLEQ